MEKQNYHPYLKTILIILTLTLIVITGSLIITTLQSTNKESRNSINNQTTNNKKSKKEQTSTTITTAPQSKGIISLKTENNRETFNKGETINLYVYADSVNQPVVGYDVVLNYDSNLTEFVEHKNFLSDFQVFIKKEKKQLFITGIKNITSNTKSIFSEIPIISLIFKAKSKGKTAFSLEFKPNQKNESNLINEKSEDLLGKVIEAKIEIK